MLNNIEFISRRGAEAQRGRVEDEEDAVWGKETQLASTSLQVGFGSCVKVPQTARFKLDSIFLLIVPVGRIILGMVLVL